jgi:ABC-type hemin transport system substrate-binding protein
MPAEKKIDEVSKDIKDILDILHNMEKAHDCIITLKQENEELKKKYDELLKKYNKTWI